MTQEKGGKVKELVHNQLSGEELMSRLSKLRLEGLAAAAGPLQSQEAVGKQLINKKAVITSPAL